MDNTELAQLLKQVVDEFVVDFVVVAEGDDVAHVILCEGEKEEFLSLYNSSFFDSEAIHGLYESLKVAILPQMILQGGKFCYLGLLDEKYVYGVFGKTDKSTKEQYYLSKEIDGFLQSRRSEQWRSNRGN